MSAPASSSGSSVDMALSFTEEAASASSFRGEDSQRNGTASAGELEGKSSHNFEQLEREILDRSVSNSWEEAKREWELWLIYEHPGGNCLCKQPITDLCVLRNRVTGKEVAVGEACVDKFGKEISVQYRLAFEGYKRVKADPDNHRAKPTIIELCRDRGLLEKRRANRYLDICRDWSRTNDKGVWMIILSPVNKEIVSALSQPPPTCDKCGHWQIAKTPTFVCRCPSTEGILNVSLGGLLLVTQKWFGQEKVLDVIEEAMVRATGNPIVKLQGREIQSIQLFYRQRDSNWIALPIPMDALCADLSPNGTVKVELKDLSQPEPRPSSPKKPRLSKEFVGQQTVPAAAATDTADSASGLSEAASSQPLAPAPPAPAPVKEFADAAQTIPLGEGHKDYDGREALVFKRGFDSSLPVSWLQQGQDIAAAICQLRKEISRSTATAFLISPHLLLTNQHVLQSAEMARNAKLTFDNHDLNSEKRLEEGKLRPERFFFASEELDFAICYYEITSQDPRPRPYIPLCFGQLSLQPDPRLSILHHPVGQPLRLSVFTGESKVQPNGSCIHYGLDTQKGSSGAPVFNMQWKLVALHHESVPVRNAKGELENWDGGVFRQGVDKPETIKCKDNEGILVDAILYHIFQEVYPQMKMFPEKLELLVELLKQDESPAMTAQLLMRRMTRPLTGSVRQPVLEGDRAWCTVCDEDIEAKQNRQSGRGEWFLTCYNTQNHPDGKPVYANKMTQGPADRA